MFSQLQNHASIVAQLHKKMKRERSDHAATVKRLQEQEAMWRKQMSERTVTRLSSAVAEASEMAMGG